MGFKWFVDGLMSAETSFGGKEIYKIYAESFKGKTHLQSIQQEAQAIVSEAFQATGA